MALDCVNITIVGGGGVVPASAPRTVYADPTAALAAANATHDSTPEINAMVAVVGDVHIVWNTSTCTTKKQLRNALRLVESMVDGITTLT